MRQIDFAPERFVQEHPDQQQWWTDWQQKADAATADVLAAWNNSDPAEVKNILERKKGIWAELKGWLLVHVYFGKCAYCESKFTGNSYGDAEHWRPKNRVTVKQSGTAKTIKRPDGSDHPGYFWLAFDWRNLFPACERCNGGVAKMNQFPLKEGKLHNCEPGKSPDELDALENPLLLHPYQRDSPTKHLEFHERGEVVPCHNSDHGHNSIDVYALDRGDLVSDREERQEDARLAFADAIAERLKRGTPVDESMERFTGPRARFSMAVKAYVELKGHDLVRELLAGNGR